MYSNWVVANANGETATSRSTSRPDSRSTSLSAFDAWLADGEEEAGPFQRGPEYVPPGTEKAKAAKDRANAKQAEALEFNEKGDNYSLMTVMFALVLFLAAIAQRGGSALATGVVLGLAGAARAHRADRPA